MNRLQTQERERGGNQQQPSPYYNMLAQQSPYMGGESDGYGHSGGSYLTGFQPEMSQPGPYSPSMPLNFWEDFYPHGGADGAWQGGAYTTQTFRQGGPQAPQGPGGGQNDDDDPDAPAGHPKVWNRGQPSGGRYGYELDSSVPWDYHQIAGYDFNGPNVPGLGTASGVPARPPRPLRPGTGGQ